MGAIRTEVREQHLSQYPQEESFLKAFIPNFFVTWGKKRKASNTELSVYFLNPEGFITEAYGIELEMMLAYSQFTTMEPRAVQAVEAFFADAPAKGRVEKFVYFFVAEDQNIVNWFHQYAIENKEARLVIPIYAEDLRQNCNDPWFVRNKMNEFIYSRDLFDVRLPLQQDISFFGRGDLVLSLKDSAKRSENRGVFGLRKTGKTSLLYKLERLIKTEGAVKSFYYDCKLASIRKLRWNELLAVICRDLATAYSIALIISDDERTIDRTFAQIVGQIEGRVLLIFDEIEYVSPKAIADEHWRKDFVTFWQAFWAVQSKARKISALIAGVNPQVVEIDAFDGIQNPLFGIVHHEYLRGLSIDETRPMIRTLGRRMGLKFTPEAIDHLQKHYGGHPLLTRLACSIFNAQCAEKSLPRPIEVSVAKLLEDQEKRDNDLVFYCRHVVSELRQFYLSEYEMLELLACGQIVDFMELDFQMDTTTHLIAYGLVEKEAGKVPVVAIPVIGKFVAMEQARRSGRRTLAYVTPLSGREAWFERRKEGVLNDMRLLETTIIAAHKPPLYGSASVPEADHFMKMKVVQTADDFERFINVCNRCLVEGIENYGKNAAKPKYFWNEIKNEYPELHESLLRVKSYRHERFHIQLTEQASAELIRFLKEDLEGKSINSIQDGYFVLQQCVMDSLLTAIQIETVALS
jgi:hypothetical protein